MTVAITEVVCPEVFSRKLAERLGEVKYKLWFRVARFSILGHTLRVDVPNAFIAARVRSHFQSQLNGLAQEELGEGSTVHVEVDGALAQFQPDAEMPDAPPPCLTKPVPAAIRPMEQVVPREGVTPPRPQQVNRRLQLKHGLEDFVVGPSNALAFNAVCRLADRADSPMRVLFIHGGCGMGKTHLLQGLCKRFLETHPGGRYLYTSAEQFTNQFIFAMRNNKLADFRRRIRHLDLLAVDDVHFLSSKDATQSEFQHTFDAMDLGGAKIALASDAHPKVIDNLTETLVSRFMCGMVVRVEPPDLELREQIIRRLALKRGLNLVDTAVRQLALQPIGSIREIEGSMTKLAALAQLDPSPTPSGAPIGHSLVGRLLDTQASPVYRKPVRIEQIIRVVCRELQVEKSQLMGRSRHRRIVLARSAAIHLARKHTPLSYPELARAMGKPNHSTIVTAAQRIAQQLRDKLGLTPADTHLATSVDQLLDHLNRAVLSERE